MNKPVRKKTALVTGASYGIGAAIAIELAKRGFDIAITELALDKLELTVQELEKLGAQTTTAVLDLRDPLSIKNSFKAVVEDFGQIDLLVNNAGIPSVRKPVLEISKEEWTEVINVNLKGAFLMCKEMGRHLIETGREGVIVNLSSTHGIVAFPSAAAYGVAKAGINQMTRMLAIEWANKGIRVNAVAPGPTDTKTRMAAHRDPEQKSYLLGRVPLGRFGNKTEIAHAVCYLASDEASFVTGHILVTDGGVTAQ